MAIFIDEPLWPAHGTQWSHLVSDDSLTELHRFAGSIGIPARAFDGDHYDVPAAMLGDMVSAGARRVDTRAMVRILAASGLRAARPRSAKPHYRSRDKSLIAAVVTPGDTVELDVGELDVGAAPVPSELQGYDGFLTGATFGEVIAKARALEPAVDAVVVVDGADAADGGAVERLRTVYLEGTAIDGRSNYRHPAGAWVLGRVHWAAARDGGRPDVEPDDEAVTEGNSMASPRDVEIRDTTIRLGQLLKLAGIIGDGSEAKTILADGGVSVNGEPEDRRGRQVHPGDIVDAAGETVRVVAS